MTVPDKGSWSKDGHVCEEDDSEFVILWSKEVHDVVVLSRILVTRSSRSSSCSCLLFSCLRDQTPSALIFCLVPCRWLPIFVLFFLAFFASFCFTPNNTWQSETRGEKSEETQCNLCWFQRKRERGREEGKKLSCASWFDYFWYGKNWDREREKEVREEDGEEDGEEDRCTGRQKQSRRGNACSLFASSRLQFHFEKEIIRYHFLKYSTLPSYPSLLPFLFILSLKLRNQHEANSKRQDQEEEESRPRCYSWERKENFSLGIQ